MPFIVSCVWRLVQQAGRWIRDRASEQRRVLPSGWWMEEVREVRGPPAHLRMTLLGIVLRSAATGCFTSTGLGFLAKIHDRPLQECGQAEGTQCVYVCVCVKSCWRYNLCVRLCTLWIYICVHNKCCNCYLCQTVDLPILLNLDWELTLEDDLVGPLKGSQGLSCKTHKFVMREKRTSIRKEHWPEQLYYCQRFTLCFIPDCHS